MPRGSKKGERRGGRQKGARNKKILERERQAQLTAERRREVVGQEGIEKEYAQQRTAGVKLAKEVL